MSAPIRQALACVLGLAAASGAQALTCYVVFDRNENVIYRDIYPPVDMSAQGAPERFALRKRGEYLMFTETDRCPPVEFVTGNAGTVAVDLEGSAPASPTPKAATRARPTPPASPPPAR